MNDSNIILNIKIVVRIQLLSLSDDDESFFLCNIEDLKNESRNIKAKIVMRG